MTRSEPEADRGPRAGSPRGVVEATGSFVELPPYQNREPVATGSFVE
jgi:hypothetical protein